MEFTLVYRGPLKSNGKPKHKHAIRRIFHEQLKKLLSKENIEKLEPPEEILVYNYDEKGICTEKDVGEFRFTALVNTNINLVAELSINMLWPEAAGAIITRGGDIDNRLKTLLDALRMPTVESELPTCASPGDGETPFYCLLEDDKLVTRLNVVTDRLLESPEDGAQSYVNLQIHVKTKPTKLTYNNMGLV